MDICRILVIVIGAPLKVAIVAAEVFPKASRPDASFSLF
jgi:hypothetical protein